MKAKLVECVRAAALWILSPAFAFERTGARAGWLANQTPETTNATNGPVAGNDRLQLFRELR